MFQTKIGPFNGSSWEATIQQALKLKHDDYQQMPASPGDYGLEGYTVKTGHAFQCYCPNTHYTRQELYEKQRDKITTDLNKLVTNSTEIAQRLGACKIQLWHFVTPEFDKNALNKHATTKLQEILKHNLPFLSPTFAITIQDADHYILEINKIKYATGEELILFNNPTALPALSATPEQYDTNIKTKSEARLNTKKGATTYHELLTELITRTRTTFLNCDSKLKDINDNAPMAHHKLVRLITEFENHLLDDCITWNDTPEKLYSRTLDGLVARLTTGLGSSLSVADANDIARHIVARWLAVCQLDFK